MTSCSPGTAAVLRQARAVVEVVPVSDKLSLARLSHLQMGHRLDVVREELALDTRMAS